jgi:RNA polymerase sigma-70 factor (ECF subfamily)
MNLQGDPGVFSDPASGRSETYVATATAQSVVRSLDVFRDYLTMVATCELGQDLTAKVSASDIVQETFLAAGRDLAQFHGRGPTETRSWLRGILQNLLANTRRHYRGTIKRRVSRELRLSLARNSDSRDLMAAIASSITSPSGRAMRSERATALRAVMEVLPERYRQVIQWHHQERLPFEAIAARLDISAEAARKVWGRALLRLRDALGPGHDPR